MIMNIIIIMMMIIIIITIIEQPSAFRRPFGLQAQSRGSVKLVGVKGWFDDDEDEDEDEGDADDEADDD